MKVKTSQEGGKGSFERPHIAEGLYQARFKRLTEISEGQYGARVAFIFSVKDQNGEDKELAHVCYVPDVATPNNKFGKALEALGVDLGQEIDTDSLPEMDCRVMVEDFTYEDNNGKEQKASHISKVKPLNEPKQQNTQNNNSFGAPVQKMQQNQQ